jgi:hypothetical protein
MTSNKNLTNFSSGSIKHLSQQEKLNRHDSLCDIVSGILHTTNSNSPIETLKIYDKGEMDVYCNNIYYEIKCNYTHKNVKKAKEQIERAIDYNQANYGYIVTYQGVFDILSDQIIKL